MGVLTGLTIAELEGVGSGGGAAVGRGRTRT
jgi:hypothetical protein